MSKTIGNVIILELGMVFFIVYIYLYLISKTDVLFLEPGMVFFTVYIIIYLYLISKTDVLFLELGMVFVLNLYPIQQILGY